MPQKKALGFGVRFFLENTSVCSLKFKLEIVRADLFWCLEPVERSQLSYCNQQIVSKRLTSLGRAFPVRRGQNEAREPYLPLNALVKLASEQLVSPSNVIWTPWLWSQYQLCQDGSGRNDSGGRKRFLLAMFEMIWTSYYYGLNGLNINSIWTWYH